MKTIFDYINSILYTKNSNSLESVDDESQFSAYMTNRWISMHSLELAIIVNMTTNKYCGIFDNKKSLFDFYLSIFPKLKYKRIQYIKKAAKEKESDAVDITPLIAVNMECSQREIKSNRILVDYLKEQIKQ